MLAELARVDPPVARHAEVEDHRVAAVGVDQPIFGAAAEAGHPRAGQPLAEVDREGPAQVGAARLDAAMRRPSSTRARPRTVVSTSGSSGMAPRYGGARAQAPLEARTHERSKVNFGDELVSPEEKTRRVGAVFSSVARRYDMMNDLMSGGMHRLWKDRFVARVKPRPGEAILDMAGGTGDVAFRMARRGAQVTVADINPDMLEVGKERADEARDHGPRMEGRECREAELRRCQLRRLHDRLRHPERHRHSRRARRSAPRAEARRALLLHGILDRATGRASPSSTKPLRRT